MCLEIGPNVGFANQRRQLDLRRIEFRSMMLCIDPATCLAGDFESRSSRWMDPYGESPINRAERGGIREFSAGIQFRRVSGRAMNEANGRRTSP